MGQMLARSPLAAYVALAYLFTWGVGLPLLAARRGWSDFHPGEGWEAVAAFGPLLAALAVSWAAGGRAACAALLAGMTRWRGGTRWLLFSVLSPVVLLVAAALLVRLATGTWPDTTGLGSGRLATAGGLVSLLVISGLVQGVGEEPGWRGFMLPRLRARYGALVATLVLFPAWLFWHLPAFLGRPEFGLAQWLGFSLGVLSAAVWLTLIWEHTASSALAIAWHTMINITRGIALAISMPMFLALSALVLAGGIVIAGCWILQGRRDRAQQPR